MSCDEAHSRRRRRSTAEEKNSLLLLFSLSTLSLLPNVTASINSLPSPWMMDAACRRRPRTRCTPSRRRYERGSRKEKRKKAKPNDLMPSIVFLSPPSSIRTPHFYAFRVRGPLRSSFRDIFSRFEKEKDTKRASKLPFGSSKTFLLLNVLFRAELNRFYIGIIIQSMFIISI